MPINIDRNAHVVTLSWLDRRRWRRKLHNKVGSPWLDDDPDRQHYIDWAAISNLGDCCHRSEDLWLEIQERVGHTVLLADYSEQCYRALRFMYSPVAVKLNEMD